MHTQILIAGGGVIGSAIACALVERGVREVVVVDLDLQGTYASSELNAGGARATWWQAVNIASCRDTLAYFEAQAEEIGFRPTGYLWLYDDRSLFDEACRRRELQARLGVTVDLLGIEEVRARLPLIDRHLDELVGATFSPGDGLVNPNAVRRHYRARAEAGGARFLDRHYVVGIEAVEREAGIHRVARIDVVEIGRTAPTDESGLVERILTQHRVPSEAVREHPSIHPEILVNALGAWSPILSAHLGIPDVTRPVRRQIAMVDPYRGDWPKEVELERLGMVVDASRLYLHGEGAYVLAGYSSPAEPSGYAFHYEGEDFFETQIWPRLAHRMSAFERCRHVRGWSGLYAVTPDCSGVLGWAPGFSNVLEAHSFTGRGVMQSRAVGVALAELVCDGGYTTLDLSDLDPRRFHVDPPRWVREDLHI